MRYEGRSAIGPGDGCRLSAQKTLYPIWERPHHADRRLRTLRHFWEKHPQAETPIRVWYAAASKADWKSPDEVKRQFGAAIDFISDNRIIFDLSGNKYTLIVHVSYTYKRVLVKFVGTHAE